MSKDKKNTNNNSNTSKKSEIVALRKQSFKDNRELYKMIERNHIYQNR